MPAPLVAMEFGSRVYGTQLPTSDRDVKFLFLPHPRDLLLERAPHTSHALPGLEADVEGYSLSYFLSLAMQGQTVSMEMLFVPKAFYLAEPHPIWQEILAERHRLVTRNATKFVSYCRAQASRYCVKGERLASLQALVESLERLPAHTPLVAHEAELRDLCGRHQHMAFLDIPHRKTDVPQPHFEVCDRRVPVQASVKLALDVFRRALGEYGRRAHLAGKAGGTDWKALMHAVRIAEEAEELLTTGHITLPRPNADELRGIRLGEVPLKTVEERIEEGTARAEAALAASSLPAEPDAKFWENFVERCHGAMLMEWLTERT